MSETENDKGGDDNSKSDDLVFMTESQKLTQMDRIEALIKRLEENLKKSNKKIEKSIKSLSSRMDSIEENLKESNNKIEKINQIVILTNG